jgi:hypothetical protein
MNTHAVTIIIGPVGPAICAGVPPKKSPLRLRVES